MIIFAVAALIRVVFCIIWNIPPTSDFLSTYEVAGKIAACSLSEWRELLGTTYTDIWPHITPYIIYESIIIKLFPNKSILVLQIINILASSGTSVLLYKIGARIYGETAGVVVSWLYVLNPTVLFFISVLTCQHIALFFLVLGIYILIKQPYKKPLINLIVAGIAEAISNLFRPEVVIINIALFCIAIIFSLKKDVKKAVKSYTVYIISYISILMATNSILMGNGIINKSILNTNMAYKFLVGLNYEHHGTWNEKDSAMMSEDEEEIWKLVKERLKEPIKIGELIKEKIYITYGSYTNYSSYTYWGEENPKSFFQEYILSALCNGYMLIVIFLSFIKCFTIDTDISVYECFIVISTLGLCMIFTLIETSNRYSYVIIPFFTLLAGSAWERLDMCIRQRKNMWLDVGDN
ncbi:MAG: glycosyltransferase family 39 protein [Anaeroplasmataceae bacterium]|nr:glycosyltransferase family 39 protein [Anaeroplasmataceae bacterium]